MSGNLKKMSVKGFKSIRNLEDFELKQLNILIGGNGAGKSNFVQLFKMLRAMAKQSFAKFILERGTAADFMYNGPQVTDKVNAEFEFMSNCSNAEGTNQYKFTLSPRADESFLIEEERKYYTTNWRNYGAPSLESRIAEQKDETSRDGQWNGVGHFVYQAISNWEVYHFHDTSDKSPMRRSEIVEDNFTLRSDGANIAPFLLNLKESDDKSYGDIVNAVKLVTPFFEDFRLDVLTRGEKEIVKLSWSQKGSDYPMQPYHFSDGTLRFIALATALLQPNPPSIVVIDEPELGLHPYAVDVLAELIEVTSNRTQVIISTQSPQLIDNFSIEDIIVVSRKGGQSTFERLNEKNFTEWLEEFSVGDLWRKNVILGGPTYE